MSNKPNQPEGKASVDVLEGNKLIAEFMKSCSFGDGVSMGLVRVAKYHSSWDWLMPCVEKINNICHERGRELSNNSRRQEHLEDPLDNPLHWKIWSYHYIHLSTNINIVWEKVVDFITWYNNTQTKKQ